MKRFYLRNEGKILFILTLILGALLLIILDLINLINLQ